MNTARWFAVFVALASILGCRTGQAELETANDLEQMKKASRAYAEAWLSNDEEAVMATLVPQPVLSPSGRPFLEGQEAARNFWFPKDTPPARVLKFETSELEAKISGPLGFVRGTFTLVFEWDRSTFTNHGTYIHILEKSDEDGWRISHHFWNDLKSSD